MKQRSYQDVKRICMMGKSEELANRVTFKLNELICWQIDQLQGQIQPSENDMQIDEGDNGTNQYLEFLKDFWIQFCQQMQSVRDIFSYLERMYLVSPQNRQDLVNNDQISSSQVVRNLSPVGFTSFWMIGLNFLRENIGKIDLKDKLVDGILNLIENDRNSQNENNRQTIAKLIHILLALQLYKGEFEEKFLQRTQEYYTKMLDEQNFNQQNLSSYLISVEGYLKNESERVFECLDISTLDKTIEIV